MRHTLRKGNVVADFLAKRGALLPDDLLILEHPLLGDVVFCRLTLRELFSLGASLLFFVNIVQHR